MGTRCVSVVAAVLTLSWLAGCGEETSLGKEATTPYDGPLHLPRGEGRHPEAGAAGDVVDCDAWGSGGAFHGEVYVEGATSDTARDAIETAWGEGMGLHLPYELAVAARSKDRVLFVFEVAGRAKEAMIMHEGPAAEGTGGYGWYLESWAICDLVEFPVDFVEGLGRQVWTDAEGDVLPTRTLDVWRGAEHCGWQAMTFLSLGPWDDKVPTFIANPLPYLREYVAEPFQPHANLPPDAVDSGFRHGEDRLWVAPDRSRAYVGSSPSDVEMWPRMVKELGCI